jgi:hypothetical protein
MINRIKNILLLMILAGSYTLVRPAAPALTDHEKSVTKQIICRHLMEVIDRFVDAGIQDEDCALLCNQLANSVDNWEPNTAAHKKELLAQRAQWVQEKLNVLCKEHPTIVIHPMLAKVLLFLSAITSKSDFNSAIKELSCMVRINKEQPPVAFYSNVKVPASADYVPYVPPVIRESLATRFYYWWVTRERIILKLIGVGVILAAVGAGVYYLKR